MVDQKTTELQQIAELIKNGDQSAFEQFFLLTNTQIYNFLYKYTFDKDSTKDLVQDTYIKFWSKRKEINTDLSIKALLFKIARNLALNFIERNKPTDALEVISFTDELSGNPLDNYENNFLVKDFEKSIILLPERCRVIFMLSRYHNFSYDEIAETLEISVQTVKNQMNKSITLLRKSLANYIK